MTIIVVKAKPQAKVTSALDETLKRLTHAAAVVEIEAPRALLKDAGSPSDEVLDVCKRAGVRLDYVFCSDTSDLIRNTTQSKALTEPDGTFEAMTRYRQAVETFALSKDENPELEAAFLDAEQALIMTPVSSPEGAAVKLQYPRDVGPRSRQRHKSNHLSTTQSQTHRDVALQISRALLTSDLSGVHR